MSPADRRHAYAPVAKAEDVPLELSEALHRYCHQCGQSLNRRSSNPWWITGIICFSALALTFSVCAYDKKLPFAPTDEKSLRDSQDYFPKIATVHSSFLMGQLSYQDQGPAGDKLWSDLIPAGGGFVLVENPRQYDLPQSQPWTGERPGLATDQTEYVEVYGATVVHQLHCLVILRKILIAFQNGQDYEQFKAWHVPHCLNYHVQPQVFFDGEGAIHKCRDWPTIYDFLEEHRKGNSSESSDSLGLGP